MKKLKISNLNIYQSFKFFPHNVQSAICSIIDNSISSFKREGNLNENAIIVVYWNDDENWIQIMDNSEGFNLNEIEHLWSTFESKDSNNIALKQAAFFLGDSLTIESKNKEFGFITKLDLSQQNSNEVDINFLNPNDLIRSFNSGVRITIDGLNKSLSNDDLKNIYNDLSFIYKDYLQKNKISIIFAYLKNNTIYDLSSNEMIPVKNISSINKLSFKFPEHNSSKTIEINETIELNNKKINISGKAYSFLVSNKFDGISYSNTNRVIIMPSNEKKPKWFDSSFKSILVDLYINGIDINATSNNFCWDNKIRDFIEDIICQKIQPLKVVAPKNLTKPLINPDDDKYKTKSFKNASTSTLKETKAFLTKAFNETNSLGYVDEFEIIKDKLHFTYNSDDGKKITMNLIKSKQKDVKDDWIQILPIDQDDVEQIYQYDLKLNLNHPFFIKLMVDNETSLLIEHFVICYAIAEIISKLDGSPVTQLKYEINKLLRGNNDK